MVVPIRIEVTFQKKGEPYHRYKGKDLNQNGTQNIRRKKANEEKSCFIYGLVILVLVRDHGQQREVIAKAQPHLNISTHDSFLNNDIKIDETHFCAVEPVCL